MVGGFTTKEVGTLIYIVYLSLNIFQLISVAKLKTTTTLLINITPIILD